MPTTTKKKSKNEIVNTNDTQYYTVSDGKSNLLLLTYARHTQVWRLYEACAQSGNEGGLLRFPINKFILLQNVLRHEAIGTIRVTFTCNTFDYRPNHKRLDLNTTWIQIRHNFYVTSMNFHSVVDSAFSEFFARKIPKNLLRKQQQLPRRDVFFRVAKGQFS